MISNEQRKTLTVLIFDSGVGGLSVYNEIRQLLPDLHYIYVFDNEGFPYGDKSEETLIKRVSCIIAKIEQQYQIDIAVIACNTASTICLPILRELFTFPIVGVVPAIKPAAKISQNRQIGLLATKATIKRAYTSNLIEQFAPDCHVELLGLSELALIAEDKLHGEAVNMQQLTDLMQPWLSLDKQLDTIVLGCTHYPFIEDELKQLFPNVVFIDSGYAIACRVAFLLQDLLSEQHFDKSDKGNLVISTVFDSKVKELMPTLIKYNLTNYQTLTIAVV